jgi:hypothetical protein
MKSFDNKYLRYRFRNPIEERRRLFLREQHRHDLSCEPRLPHRRYRLHNGDAQ